MKNILLIGGSYGIGAAIAKQLTDTHKVYVASRTQENIPQGVTHMVFDALTDDISTSPLPDQIDGLVYCPGSINLKPPMLQLLVTWIPTYIGIPIYHVGSYMCML